MTLRVPVRQNTNLPGFTAGELPIADVFWRDSWMIRVGFWSERRDLPESVHGKCAAQGYDDSQPETGKKAY